MPRQAASKTYNTYVAGLVTEATPLTYPENAVSDALNCIFNRQGNVSRRLGIDYESGYSATSESIANALWETQAIQAMEWTNVGGDGGLTFIVIQVDDTLYYFDAGSDPMSDGMKSFTTDLSAFAAPAATDVGTEQVITDSGKGYFFISGKKLKPFYVSYDSDTDSITNTEIGIQIRDFDGVDDSLEIDEEIATLSTEHNYNLRNQGWVSPGGSVADPISTYKSSQGKYPGNNKQWWVAKNSSNDFDPAELSKIFYGNTLAPRGHYILDPFNKDRDNVSGLSGLDTVTTDNRPGCVSFFAGRAWYGGPIESTLSGHIFFSQIIEDEAKIGRCYQEADPTSEEISDLIDTDGGVIVIPEAGNIIRLFVTGSSILVYADNGLWEVSGGSGGFTPTDYSVSKVSSIGIVGAKTLVDIEGAPIWWSDRGIYTLGRNQVTDRLEAQSLTEKTIQSFYDEDIPAGSKRYAQGSYDAVTRKVTYLYNVDGNTTTDRYQYTEVLDFDTTLGAFYPSRVESLDTDSPYVTGIFTLPSLFTVTQTADVVDSSGANVVDSSSDQVTAEQQVTGGGQTSTMFMTAIPGVTNTEWTFSLLNNNSFYDWETSDGTGKIFDSYFETGYLLEGDIINFREAVYVHTFLRRTETGYVSDGSGGYDLVNPSGCYMQAKWDYADHSNSSKWGRSQQCYRILQGYDKTPDSLDFDNGFPVTMTRNKVRGKGRSLHLRFEAEDGKDFDLYGWSLRYSINTEA